MATIIYSLFEKFERDILAGAVHAWLTDNHRVVLIKSTYTVNLATHENLDDIPSGDRVAESANLTGEAVSGNGEMKADTVVMAGVSGANITQLVLFKETGTESTSRLILHAGGYNIPPPDPFKIFWGLNGVIFDRG